MCDITGIRDIPEAIRIKITEQLCSYTVVFIMPNFEEPLKSGNGSGILIKYKNKIGIFTAAHIFAQLYKYSKYFVYIPCPVSGDLQKIYYDVNKVRYIATYNPLFELKKTNKANDPDVAFIELDINNIPKLNKNIFDISDTLEKFYSDDGQLWCFENRHDWLCVMTGASGFDKKKEYDPIKNRWNIVFPHSGAYFGGIEKIDYFTRMIGGKIYAVDFITSEISNPTIDEMPKYFAGMSGGGVWQLKLNSKFEIVGMLLAGIFTGEDPQPDSPSSDLIPQRLHGNGFKTLYSSLITLID